MPTYEYFCETCGKFDFFQSIKDKALDRCPKCGGEVRRAISAGAGLIFKGSGFYITDYRNSDYQKKAKEDSAKGTASSQAKTENKDAGGGGNGAGSGQAAPAAGGVDSKSASDSK